MSLGVSSAWAGEVVGGSVESGSGLFSDMLVGRETAVMQDVVCGR